jgi:ankyrin repeat protein
MDASLQREDLEGFFSSPEVRQRWLELETWLRKYSIYWRDEVVGLITHIELLVYDSLRLADKKGIDKALVSGILSSRIRELLLSFNIQPENIAGYELKGMRKDVAEVLSQIFPKLKNPYQGHIGKIAAEPTKKPYREISISELFYAVKNGDFSSVRELIDKGVNVNATDTEGWTPIHYAAAKGLSKIAQILIERGADPNVIQEKTCLTPLHLAVIYGHYELAKLLLEKGADPNKRTREGWTPLHFAVAYDRHDVATLLLQKGADPNVQDFNGKTPLHWAVENNRLGLVKLLGERGASLEIKDGNGKTPLDYAQDKGLRNMLIPKKIESDEEHKLEHNSELNKVETLDGDKICPVCGTRLVFIKAINRYYCFRCKNYR